VVNEAHEAMRRITQPWPTRDGRWFLPHFGLPNLQQRVLKVLGAQPDPVSVAKAVAQWDALDLEAAIDEARACGAMVRANTEWLAHPHGQALAAKPIVEIMKIGDSGPEPLPQGDHPLTGIRVDPRILAGPIAARTLAEHGADVLMVAAERLPQIPEHVMDTSHGKRSCFLDLATPADAARLRTLVEGADVFSQGYRPGVLQKLGFGPKELAAHRPGIIYVSISCFGADGPFSHRGGWEQVAQTVTGICNEGRPDRPALAGSGLRLHHRLSRRLRCPAGVGTAVAPRRQLSCPRFTLPIRHVHLSSGQGRFLRARHGPVGDGTRCVAN
jgi:hypothetical protein